MSTDSIDSKSIPTSSPKTKPERVRPNPIYIDFYNRFIQQTFNPTSQPSYRKLKHSKITHTGHVYIYSRSQESSIPNESTPGTLWTPQEKEIFFDSLSKYSIHRFDLIQSRLKTKTKIEIMNYYNLLSHELKKLKSRKRHRRDKYKLRKWSSKLLRYDKLPIAYEISEYFIKFEEIQSGLMTKKERIREKRNERRFANDMKIYEPISLFDIKTMNELSTLATTTYNSQNSTSSWQPQAVSPGIGLESIILLEEIIKLLTKSIILSIISSQKTPTRIITKSDIYSAIRKLGYINPNQYFVLDNYWKGCLNRYKSHQSKLSNRIQTLITPPSAFIIPQRLDKNEIGEMDRDDGDEGIIHINSLKQENPNMSQLLLDPLPDIKPILDHEDEESISEEFEDMLLVQECQELEMQDMTDSKMYERGLVTMLLNEGNYNEEDTEEIERLAEIWIDEENERKSKEREEGDIEDSGDDEHDQDSEEEEGGFINGSMSNGGEESGTGNIKKISPDKLHKALVNSYYYRFATYQ
ncbi:uncharacterized protein J8A68_003124 [[Candida] subhashii]|uniref:Myb-like domain-containing protein n=1 Tax=[Candida] subhashii TaxID=561895 RepID=A0A8J5UML9_9ASCO|nr:uncharacterized protein J8A68_003124 [[Candida] subhashii]KAG7663376.1 hypothetical protein J8A68_003124 [[Candida] subhashii]